MYTLFHDAYLGDRTKISLNVKGRSEFRKDFAKFSIVLAIILWGVAGVIHSAVYLNTTQLEYANHISDVRAQNTHQLKVALSNLQ